MILNYIEYSIYFKYVIESVRKQAKGMQGTLLDIFYQKKEILSLTILPFEQFEITAKTDF